MPLGMMHYFVPKGTSIFGDIHHPTFTCGAN